MHSLVCVHIKFVKLIKKKTSVYFFIHLKSLTPLCSPSFRYFFAVLAILTLLGILNGLVLLPVLLSLIGPPAEAKPDDNAGHWPAPTPEPLLPPPMTHHGHYKGHHNVPPPSGQQAYPSLSDSEYSEGTSSSGIGMDASEYCDSSMNVAPPNTVPSAISDILLEASKNPSFPKMKVRRTGAAAKESPPSCLSVLHRMRKGKMFHFVSRRW